MRFSPLEIVMELVLVLIFLCAIASVIAPELHQAIHALAVISPCANCREAMLR